jgi:hypothetical protein
VTKKVVLAILITGPIRCQMFIDWNRANSTGPGAPLECATNSGDYQLLDDGRIVHTGRPAGDVMLTLPAGKWHKGAKLLGLFEEKAVLGWDVPDEESNHHFQVFYGHAGQTTKLLREFALPGASSVAVRSCRTEILIDIQGGAYWGTTYLLRPDGSPQKLFQASSSEELDLNRDGVYELVVWDWHTIVLRCDMSMFGAGPKIYAPGPAGDAYRQIWPLEGGPFQIKGVLASLEGERTTDLVTLTDQRSGDPPSYGPQYLALYRLQSNALHLVTQTPIGRSRIAFYLSSELDSHGERRFLVWYTSAGGCQTPGGDKFKAIYAFRAGRLQQIGTAKVDIKDQDNAGQPLDR